MSLYCPVKAEDVMYLRCLECKYRGNCRDGIINQKEELSSLGRYLDINKVIAIVNATTGEHISSSASIIDFLPVLGRCIYMHSPSLPEHGFLLSVRKQIRALSNCWDV